MKCFSWPIIAVLALFLNLDFAAGQLVDRHGLKLGASMNTVTGPDAGAFKNKQIIAGLTGGGFATVKLLKRISLQNELLVSHKGFAYDPKILTFVGRPPKSVVFGTRVTHINIHTLAVFHAFSLLDIYAGPYCGFFISGKEWHQFNSDKSWHHLSHDDVLGSDKGYTLGAAFHLSKITLDLRLNQGMSPFLMKNYNLRNHQLILLVGWQY